MLLNALEQSAGMPVKEFFPLLREKKSPRLAEHWEDYLNHLAFAMKNLNLIIDAPIIISGYLAPYFTEEDITYLLEHINTGAPFTWIKIRSWSVPTGSIHLPLVQLYIMWKNLYRAYEYRQLHLNRSKKHVIHSQTDIT